ncbi:GFA family protein [Phenylobacterium sp. LH3H17]|uniref:GFA family protein n=1 Tax=Phenylobacterium sp. LH3H17 TaxID=2903901 RepID=UPI0020C997E2|nr:GFA family protein [Phenylobacterium sp. LH3H17]UTP40796.1 GFA family protein [Phenylobacterium sp. LH3H17]
MHTGSCLCRAVRFEVTGDLAPVQVCHCGDCRKAQGSAFGANIPVATADFTLLSGEGELRAYESSPGKERVFCSRCGSPVFSRLTGKPGVVRLRAGSLDEPVATEIGFHFYVASKASWWPIAGEATSYDGERPA